MLIPSSYPETFFPDNNDAIDDQDGLIAVSESFTPERVLAAYCRGIFPWFEQQNFVFWFTPPERFVFHPLQWQANRSLKRTVRQLSHCSISINRAFDQVIQACALSANRKSEEESWITQRFIAVYQQLHQQGWAHSVEVWHQDQLIGGLYGIGFDHYFAGESMFSTQSGASKLAFWHLMLLAKHNQWDLVDGQVDSEHLHQLGGFSLPRDDFTDIVNAQKIMPLSLAIP